jgi:predicted nucleotide-binding protein
MPHTANRNVSGNVKKSISMSKSPKVFLSYAHVDTEFVYRNFILLLRQLEINLLIAGEVIELGQSINEVISKGIQSSDLIICIYNKKALL